MHDERLTAAETLSASSLGAAAMAEQSGRSGRDKRARRVVFGLTGLLGAAWAVVVASRYAGVLPG